MLTAAPVGGFFGDALTFGAAKKLFGLDYVRKAAQKRTLLAAKAKKVAVARRKLTAAKTATKAAVVAAKAASTVPQAVKLDRITAKRLQAALVSLGKVAGSAQLKAIKVDGAVGAKTVAAVNFAFTKHIGPGQAPAQYRTGKLNINAVKANAAAIASVIETEVRRRGGTPASIATVAKAQKGTKVSATAAARKAIVSSAKAKKAASKKNAARARGSKAKQFVKNAKKQAAVLKAKARAERARAARLKAEGRAAEAAALEVDAAKQEQVAEQFEQQGAQASQAVIAAEGEAAAAANEEAGEAEAAKAAAYAAQEAAEEERTDAVRAVVKAAPPPPPPPPGADGDFTPTAQPMVTTMEPAIPTGPTPSTETGVSFFARYKVPVIAGGIGLLGLLAIALMPKSAGRAAPGPRRGKAPAMAGAKYRRRRR